MFPIFKIFCITDNYILYIITCKLTLQNYVIVFHNVFVTDKLKIGINGINISTVFIKQKLAVGGIWALKVKLLDDLIMKTETQCKENKAWHHLKFSTI